MASYPQGYEEERFAISVNQNFLCLICFNVLKDPVQCAKNEHHFCRACITKFLENSRRCPTCADELTVDTLTKAPRMVKDYLNELNIHCKYVNRGCHDIVQLQHLDRHEAACGFTPVICANQGCGATVNRRDLIHHESELCEFRKLKCHSCGELSKTLVDIEKRMAKMESKMTKIETNEANLGKNMERNKADMEGNFEAVNNEVRGLKAALIEGFNEMKEALVKTEDKKEENTRKARPGASGDKEKENIIVAGGRQNDSVEIFNWRQRTWSPLQSLPEKRGGETSFVYNDHLYIAGGYCTSPGCFDNIIRMNIDPHSHVPAHWSVSPIKLSAMLTHHSSVVYKDQLIVTGGCCGSATFDCIDEVQLVPPYAVKTLSRMPEPRRGHSTEIFDDSLLIVGGRTTTRWQDNLSSVTLYDIKKNEWKQLAPLPYEVSSMATVRWGDNIVVIGGVNKQGRRLDTVIIYNVKTEQYHMLPSMSCKRGECAAVATGNNIVVLGGWGENSNLKSVESFNFDRYTWQDLPEMSQERCSHTAVIV